MLGSIYFLWTHISLSRTDEFLYSQTGHPINGNYLDISQKTINFDSFYAFIMNFDYICGNVLTCLDNIYVTKGKGNKNV